MKLQKAPKLMSEGTADLVHLVCRLLIKHKDYKRLEEYCKDIKLKEQFCTKCNKDTPIVISDAYSFCCYCLKEN